MADAVSGRLRDGEAAGAHCRDLCEVHGGQSRRRLRVHIHRTAGEQGKLDRACAPGGKNVDAKNGSGLHITINIQLVA